VNQVNLLLHLYCSLQQQPARHQYRTKFVNDIKKTQQRYCVEAVVDICAPGAYVITHVDSKVTKWKALGHGQSGKKKTVPNGIIHSC